MRRQRTTKHRLADIACAVLVIGRDLAIALIGATVFGLAIGSMVARDMPHGEVHANALLIARELDRR